MLIYRFLRLTLSFNKISLPPRIYLRSNPQTTPMRQRLTLLFVFLFALSAGPLRAQTPALPKPPSEIEKPSRDFVMLQLTYEGWANKPDSVKTGGIGRGFNAYLCYDFPIQKSHFSFAAGIGVGTANIYLDNQQMVLTDTGARGNSVRFINETTDYKKYKLTTAYLEAPFELRYFGNNANRNKGFKAAIGMRAGTLVGAHVKDVRTVDGNKVVDKTNTKRYLEKWRFSGTLRLGYGNFSVFGSYNLNTLFKEGSGPDIVPYSIGLCITGL